MSNSVVSWDMTPCSLVVSLSHTTPHNAERARMFITCFGNNFSILHYYAAAVGFYSSMTQGTQMKCDRMGAACSTRGSDNKHSKKLSHTT